MEKQAMINCPNCNKRTLEDKKECIYCKYILKDEHNFDNQIYKFLYDKYNENKNKPETIKVGMKKFGLTMKEIKEVVDYISEQVYQNEEATKNKEIIEKQDKPREELPTNGIDYSKYINYSCYTGQKKNFIIKVLGVILCWVMLVLMCINEIGSLGIRLVAIVLNTILYIKLVTSETVPLNPHTFVFSFFQFFIRCILPMLIAISLIVFILIQIIKYVPNCEPIITVLSLGTFVVSMWYLVIFGRQGEFTADYGNITYRRAVYGNAEEEHFEEESYIIYYIKEVKETLNSIIIYGDIRKRYYKIRGLSSDLTPEEKISKLKVMKNFKNNRELIKSLQILSKK